MSAAFDHTFQAPVPGISLAHHKLGDLPHEKPPEYTDPDEALHYFWKMLTRVDIQRQIWSILKMPGATVWAVARAILFKAAMQGVIQMNLGVVIYPTVMQMIHTIAKAGGVNATMSPKTKSPQKEQYIKEKLKELLAKSDKHGWLTGQPQTPPETPPDQTTTPPTGTPAPAQGQDQSPPPPTMPTTPSQGTGLLSGIANQQAPGGQQ